MSNQNRVQAGVPTGGQFATGAKHENGDLMVDPDEAREAAIMEIASDDELDREDKVRKLTEIVGITAKVRPLGRRRDKQGWDHDAWSVQVTNPLTGVTVNYPFKTGTGWTEPPDVKDVMVCFADDAATWEFDEYEDYAQMMGLDYDDPNQKRTLDALWRRAEEFNGQAREFFGDHFDAFV